MLVLTRKSEEKITIGRDNKIVVTILKIQGDKVSIGIEADPDTPIFRNELIERRKETTQAQSQIPSQPLLQAQKQNKQQSSQQEQQESVVLEV